MNAFASSKISFWNEMRLICDEFGADVYRIRDILRRDVSRWTNEYTEPTGKPFGGACLPKDTKELVNASKNSILLKAVMERNEKL